MTQFEKQVSGDADPSTAGAYRWIVRLDDGRQIPWSGLQTGPLTLDGEEIDAICQSLLGYGVEEVARQADRFLRPAIGEKAHLPALILHSTTPELKTFDGDLDALVHDQRGGDFTTYKEARSVYLASPDDVVVGRTAAWKAAVEAMDAKAIELEDVDHYYLSHALLHLAGGYRRGSGSAIDHLVSSVSQAPRVVRLYSFELEMQIFLLWLVRIAGAEELAVEANSPAVSAAWNRKSVLHPTVERALSLEASVKGKTPLELLTLESRHSELIQRLSIELPALPGYTLSRKGRSVEEFVEQLAAAAELLQKRYGLELGCLKASESGDGARITPGIDLSDHPLLAELGREAHGHGDDYVLEAHVHYRQISVAGQTLPMALSAHIRGGEVAPGATVQFVEGTSWKGNVLLDEHCLEVFDLSLTDYQRLHRFVEDFRDACAKHCPGLVLAGVDFAVGTVGGIFGETALLGVQDMNVSFTGAECLRAFLAKASREKGSDGGHRYGVTRIYRPKAKADHHVFLNITRTFNRGPVYADTVASIAGRWAMVGITGANPEESVQNLNRLEKALIAEDLVEGI